MVRYFELLYALSMLLLSCSTRSVPRCAGKLLLHARSRFECRGLSLSLDTRALTTRRFPSVRSVT